jgi:hypothetical protein
MPVVAGREYPYTREGIAAAEAAKERLSSSGAEFALANLADELAREEEADALFRLARAEAAIPSQVQRPELGPYLPLTREEMRGVRAPNPTGGRYAPVYAPAQLDAGGEGQVPVAGPSWVRSALHDLNPPRYERQDFMFGGNATVDVADSQRHREYLNRRYGPRVQRGDSPRMALTDEMLADVERGVAATKRAYAEELPYRRAAEQTREAEATHGLVMDHARAKEAARQQALQRQFGTATERAEDILALEALRGGF